MAKLREDKYTLLFCSPKTTKDFLNVYFWHLVGGEPFGYAQKEIPSIFGALIDIQKYGLNLRQEQFFIRLSSNENLESLQKLEGFNEIIGGLSQLPLSSKEITLLN